MKILFKKKKKIKLDKELKKILNEKSEIINSLKSTYKNSYSKKILSKAKKFKQISIIGMGGSILGTEAIHSFLKHKIKKKLHFMIISKRILFSQKKIKKNLIWLYQSLEIHLKPYRMPTF